MKLKEVISEAKVWGVLKALITGKADIDPDSEYGAAIRGIENIMQKKPAGSGMTYAEIMAADLKKQGVNVDKFRH